MRSRIYLAIAACLATVFSLAPARAENWPGFRGPTGQGASSEKGLPTKWSAKENVAWTADVPGEGWSSPVVWGDRVFLTSATDGGASCRVLCFDRRTGKPLWDREVFKQELRRKEGKNSYATPTPVTDGKHVFAVFGGGGIAAVSVDGKLAWTNQVYKFYSQHGLGASPILHGDVLVMPLDGSSPDADKSVGWKKPWDKGLLLALDKATGKVAWEGQRGQSRIAHVTPNVLPGDSKQIVSGAGDVIQGFDPQNGKLLWSLYSQGEGVVPSIVVGDELVYSISGFEKPTIRGVRPGRKSDPNSAKIVWEQTKNVPLLPSLVYVKPHLFGITAEGVASCMRADTGEIVWQQRVGGKHSASPVVADGKIYFLSEDGETAIIEAAAEFKEVARNKVDAQCQASLAISQGQIFLRTAKTLLCIGAAVADDTKAADSGKKGRRVIAADYSKKLLAIVEADGKTSWKHTIGDIHDLWVLPSGNVLFQTSWTKLVEVDPGGKTVWEYNAAEANGNKGKRVEVHAIQRLPDGVTMIAESGPGRIIEVDKDGKLLREVKLKVSKPDAHRDTRLVRKLDSGNYLVAHEGDKLVREYNAKGETVWEYDVKSSVYSAIRLKNGNTLIGTGDGHRVIEVTPEKKIAWSVEENDLPGVKLAWITMVDRLPSGNTLIVNCHGGPDNPQIVEVTPEKKVAWSFKDFERFGNSLPVARVLD